MLYRGQYADQLNLVEGCGLSGENLQLSRSIFRQH